MPSTDLTVTEACCCSPEVAWALNNYGICQEIETLLDETKELSQMIKTVKIQWHDFYSLLVYCLILCHRMAQLPSDGTGFRVARAWCSSPASQEGIVNCSLEGGTIHAWESIGCARTSSPQLLNNIGFETSAF